MPLAKEGLHQCNDLMGPLDKIKARFADPSKCFGLRFDFSMCYQFGNESIWQMNVVTDLPMQKKGMDCIEDNVSNVDESNQ
eukprot:CAMPEP_0116886372 /NCGR_PEP_ID=MMETSP0463-20121206/20195_1 /TAXON_ID=181622 /ORGANISM="Strombidinopsis sp, Strain SopsisLIS2011" /LENGTH=80 /DNA_ID=CAMNT_0004546673 /DNA_START=416 /DNA_END=658 /DNA_ORIENTATION=+